MEELIRGKVFDGHIIYFKNPFKFPSPPYVKNHQGFHLQLILQIPEKGTSALASLEMNSSAALSAYYIQCKHLSRIQMSVI